MLIFDAICPISALKEDMNRKLSKIQKTIDVQEITIYYRGHE